MKPQMSRLIGDLGRDDRRLRRRADERREGTIRWGEGRDGEGKGELRGKGGRRGEGGREERGKRRGVTTHDIQIVIEIDTKENNVHQSSQSTLGNCWNPVKNGKLFSCVEIISFYRKYGKFGKFVR